MAQTYTRQSSFSDGDSITAALFNNEYNQLVNAFTYSSSDASATGHRHDGSAGQGGNIFKIGDLDFLNKVEIDSTNNRIGFYTEVSSAAVEQLRIQDGALVPVTDNDIDLGTSSLEFKDAFFDGTLTTDALVADTADINGGTVDGATIGANSASTGAFTSVTTTGNVDVGGNLTVTGTTTFNGGTLTLGDAADDNVVFGADVNSNIIPNTDNTYDLGSSSQEWKDLYVDGIAYLDGINFNGTAITSTAAELNILDGVTSTAAELNILDGVTATTTELNILDGVTSTTAELNILDGVTANTSELNILDGVTSTTAELNILDGVTATATELNLLDGVTSTTAELNILDGVTSTTAELNLLDGVTATTTELNYVDVATAGTVEASKAIVVDSNKDFTGTRNITTTGSLSAGGGSTNGIVISQGAISIKNGGTQSYVDFYCESSNAHYTRLQAAAHSAYSGNVTVTLPATTGTLALTSSDITGNAATATALETARTIHGVSFDGTANIDLTEVIQDTIGGMVTGNTESNITVTYQDSDGTLDFEIASLNQDTTGNAATATALETARTIGGTSFDGTANISVALADTATALATARTIHGVSFDGTANIDLTEVIQDTVGAMVSSNTETGIAVTYEDSDGTLDFVVAGTPTAADDITTGDAAVTIGTSSGDITLDTPGDIILDADGGDINLKDGGTTFAGFSNSSSDFLIQAGVADKDILFQGTDGSSLITALTLDMSEAGAASFNGVVTANAGVVVDNITIDGTEIDLSSGDLTIDSAGRIDLSADDNGEIRLFDGSSQYGQFKDDSDRLRIQSMISDADIMFVGNDGGSEVTALTLDMSAGGKALFNNDIERVSGDLTVSSANGSVVIDANTSSGDILLDADGGTIVFLDAGTEIGLVAIDNVGFLDFSSSVSDSDIRLRGNDGGSMITALTLDMSEAGAATFNNNVTAFSDERLKDNIETLEDGLDKVEQLRGVTYTRDGRENIGVIAQEVEKILPEIVLTADDEMGTKSVDYSRITAVLIEAVKDLSARVKELESK